MVVEGVAQRLGRRLAAKVEMGDLTERVHPGIGPPGGDHRHLLAAESAHGVFQRLLHRSAFTLPLPAAKRPAVIFQDQLVAGHGEPSRAPTGR
jgi:hypothetical protein